MNDTKQALEAVVGQIEHRPSGAYSYPSGLGAEAVSVIARHGPALLAALEDARRYRWLRQSHWYIGPEPEGDTEGVGLHDYNDGTIDAAIDAMAAGGDQPEPPQ